MKKIRILIADDHRVVREGLRALFTRAPGFSIVAEASDGVEVVQRVVQRKPDVVIMDISMPKVNGIEAVRQIKRIRHATKVLVLTIHENDEYVHQMVAAGANGYVLKDAGKEELLAAVRAVHSGERFFSPGVSKLIVEDFVKRSHAAPPAPPDSAIPLTDREGEVLQFIAQGLTNAEIAKKMFLSIRTIGTHRNNLMHKLDIHNTASLVRYAIEKGIVTPGTSDKAAASP
jgi:two-component system, NarL family, response regulator NreC